MNIHEHQAKQLLKKFGAIVPNGEACFTVQEVLEKAKKLNLKKYVLKAQIHAGGRGKAGGVKILDNLDDLEKAAKEFLEDVDQDKIPIENNVLQLDFRQIDPYLDEEMQLHYKQLNLPAEFLAIYVLSLDATRIEEQLVRTEGQNVEVWFETEDAQEAAQNENKPPQIDSVDFSNKKPRKGETTDATVTGSDPEGMELAWEWNWSGVDANQSGEATGKVRGGSDGSHGGGAATTTNSLINHCIITQCSHGQESTHHAMPHRSSKSPHHAAREPSGHSRTRSARRRRCFVDSVRCAHLRRRERARRGGRARRRDRDLRGQHPRAGGGLPGADVAVVRAAGRLIARPCSKRVCVEGRGPRVILYCARFRNDAPSIGAGRRRGGARRERLRVHHGSLVHHGGGGAQGRGFH